MTQIITNSNGGGGSGGGSGDMLKSVYDPHNIEADAFDYDNFTNTPDLSGYQTTANLVTDLTNPDNTHYPSAKAVSDAITSSGGGDMLASVYDPNNIEANAFDYDNFINTPTIPTDTLDLTNGAGYVTDSILSDTAFGVSWDSDTTHAPTKNAVYDKISDIDGLISSNATSSNKLMDKNYIDDAINSVSAYYITKNAQGDQWATYAELSVASTYYSGGVARTPTRNDYTVVLADENHDNATTRYSYQGNSWEYQYTINETAMSQAQLDALNSGITSGKVSTYDGYASGKQDALTLPVSPTQGNLVTWGADNETLVDGGAIPTGFNPGAGTAGQVLTKTADGYGYADVPSQVSDISYSAAWSGVTGTAPSKNALYNKINSIDTTVGGKQDAFHTTSSSAPVSPSEGDERYDTTNDVLKAYDGSNWKPVGGGTITNDTTGTTSTLTSIWLGNTTEFGNITPGITTAYIVF